MIKTISNDDVMKIIEECKLQYSMRWIEGVKNPVYWEEGKSFIFVERQDKCFFCITVDFLKKVLEEKSAEVT